MDAWATLPHKLKAGILAMIDAACDTDVAHRVLALTGRFQNSWATRVLCKHTCADASVGDHYAIRACKSLPHEALSHLKFLQIRGIIRC